MVSLPLAINAVPDELTTPERVQRVLKFVQKIIFKEWISYFESVYTKTHVLVLVFSFTLSWLPWVLAFFADIFYHSTEETFSTDEFEFFENLEFYHWINRIIRFIPSSIKIEHHQIPAIFHILHLFIFRKLKLICPKSF